MSKYIIKVTYLEGKHKGDSYLMKKGGYIADGKKYFLDYEVYNSERIAKSVCTRMYNNNELNRRIERNDNNYRISQGKDGKEFFIYYHESYEPYEISDERMV